MIHNEDDVFGVFTSRMYPGEESDPIIFSQ